MAPEQLDPFAVPTSAIDVFAWGCVCWFAASGSSPFAGASSSESIRRLRTWESATSRVPDALHSTLVAPVTRALSKEPSERRSAAHLVGELGGTGGVTSEMVATAWDSTADVTLVGNSTGAQTRPDFATRPSFRLSRPGVLLGVIALASLIIYVALGGSALLRPEASSSTTDGTIPIARETQDPATSTRPTEPTATAPTTPTGLARPRRSPHHPHPRAASRARRDSRATEGTGESATAPSSWE